MAVIAWVYRAVASSVLEVVVTVSHNLECKYQGVHSIR